MIDDAWWNYVQDCDGDTNYAGTLAGDFARLNWFPDVVNCNGSLSVFEKIYFRPCGTGAWIPLFTNAAHTIVGCASPNQRYLDIQMGAAGTCRDYKIEVCRVGQTSPDSIRSSTNDVDLASHKEELFSQDNCANDSFSSCVVISGASGNYSENNGNSTKEAGEPNHAGNPGGHSVWFCWTAPTNKPVTFETTGSTFDTLLGVYTGNNVASLTTITNNDDIAGSTNRMSRVTFTPTTGTTYHIAVDGYSGASGILELSWNQAGSALPDLIVWGPAASPFITTTTFAPSDCQVVEGCAIAGTRRLIRFDMETRNIGAGDLAIGNPATNSLFRFASCHNHYHFESFAQYTLLDTNLNPVLLGTNVVVGRKVGFCIEDVHAWSPTAPSSLKYTCLNDGIQAGWADVYGNTLDCQFIDITGVPAGDYILQLAVNPDGLIVESDYGNNISLLPITIPPATCTVAPANDNFASARAVGPTPYSDTEFNSCATKQAGEPNHAGDTGGHSIWYSWTPTSNHLATVTTRKSSFDTLLGVYTGNAVNALTLIASNDDVIPNINDIATKYSKVTFNAVSNTTYRIAVDGYSTNIGTAVLNVNPPANDDFTNAFQLFGPVGSTNGFNIAASKEGTNETAHAGDVGGHSVWYKWTAPSSGFVDFNTKGSSYDTTLAVYTNATLVSGSIAIASNDDDSETGGLKTSRLFFFAKAGTNYNIVLDGFGGDTGMIKLNWNMNCQLAISNLPNGKVQVSLTGVDWQRYVLLGSTNMTTWYTNTAAITMADGIHYFTNTLGATNAPLDKQFYRALLVP